MIEYLEKGDLAIFEGCKYRRDKKTGYYLNSAMHKRLHRAVWESYHGDIPKGWHVHHKDENKSNNEIENLEILSGSSHMSLHGYERAASCYDEMRRNLRENAIPKAIEWHKTPEGRKWHSDHAKAACENMRQQTYSCLFCGSAFQKKPLGQIKFCSNKCKSAYRRKEGMDNVEQTCVICGERFTTNRYSGAETCSPRCRNYLCWRGRRQANREAAGL